MWKQKIVIALNWGVIGHIKQCLSMEVEELKRFGAMLENDYNRYCCASSEKEKEDALFQLQELMKRPVLVDYFSRCPMASTSNIVKYGLDLGTEKCIQKFIEEYNNIKD